MIHIKKNLKKKKKQDIWLSPTDVPGTIQVLIILQQTKLTKIPSLLELTILEIPIEHINIWSKLCKE